MLALLILGALAVADVPVPSGRTCGSTCPVCINPAPPGAATWAPPSSCTQPSDPNNLPASPIESWLTQADFNYLFYFANQGHGPNNCAPYNYQAFVIACRYFPEFGAIVGGDTATAKLDVAGFFAQMVQETGRNYIDPGYPDDCIFRGGLYHWMEGGEACFLQTQSNCYNPYASGGTCSSAGRYCFTGDYADIFPCTSGVAGAPCFFGRGPIQLSYNSNYGNFKNWLSSKNITVDLVGHPELLFNSLAPPLAFMGSLWYYMTAQANKFSMHSVITGTWTPNTDTRTWIATAKGLNPATNTDFRAFGPLNFIINGECSTGAPSATGNGEPRRRAAFIFYCNYFGVNPSLAEPTSCASMPGTAMSYCNPNLCSWYPTVKYNDGTCDCAAQTWDSPILYQYTAEANAVAQNFCQTASPTFCTHAATNGGNRTSGGGSGGGGGTLDNGIGHECQGNADCAVAPCQWWAAVDTTVTGSGGTCTYGPNSTVHGCCINGPASRTRTRTAAAGAPTRTRTRTKTKLTHTRSATRAQFTRTKTKRTHTRTKTKRTRTRTRSQETRTRTRTKTQHTRTQSSVPAATETRTRTANANGLGSGGSGGSAAVVGGSVGGVLGGVLVGAAATVLFLKWKGRRNGGGAHRDREMM
eukprot:TRINITY_DN1048_c0_g1_i2.p1 TRINITY_DN1048_c0_g1~~TRINITY_DN1048_c0_g1_i2.p1  ORF type:complete len:652 (+),score=136.73 TRINITY_DN1048_c0_g1_i2:38-1957(+)